jgi:molecular chaperone HtpG
VDHKFQINLRGIIDLLSEHIYSTPDVFARELLQNAVDAITARKLLDADHVGEIHLECHAPKGKPPTLVITDNGVGLTLDEVHTFLSTIGLSSKKALDGKRPSDFIGQFGVGILSCFVISDEIVVITKSAKQADAKPIEWRAKGDGTYSVKELDRDFSPGTQVWLTAKSGREDVFAADNIQSLCTMYGGLLPYPIRISAGKSSTIINEDGPPWRRSYRNEKEQMKALLAFGRDVFAEEFFDAVPLKSSAGQVDGVAYILGHQLSPTAKLNHRVYLKNMFLSDTAENLLPEWAFFVRIVVNANDLRPTASRESFYEDAKLVNARAQLGEALRAYLVELAEKRPERLAKFISIHMRAIKALAVEDDEFYRLVIEWLPFETTMGHMTFGEFREHSPDRLRYVSNADSFRQLAQVAAAQKIAVVNAGYIYDAELMAKAGEAFPRLTVEVIEPTTLTQEFQDLSLEEQDAAHDFLRTADLVLKPFRVSADAKRFLPIELPTVFSTSNEGRFFRSLEQSKEIANPLWGGVFDGLSKREQAALSTAQLCFNFSNPLIQKLARVRDGKRLTRAIQMLYVQSLLLGHHPLNAKELGILNDGLLSMIEDVIA